MHGQQNDKIRKFVCYFESSTHLMFFCQVECEVEDCSLAHFSIYFLASFTDDGRRIL